MQDSVTKDSVIEDRGLTYIADQEAGVLDGVRHGQDARADVTLGHRVRGGLINKKKTKIKVLKTWRKKHNFLKFCPLKRTVSLNKTSDIIIEPHLE